MAGLLLAGCGAAAESDDPSETGSGSESPNTTAEPTPEPFVLPETCASLLSLDAIDAGLGVRINGMTQYVVGVPEPEIGRTGRVTCSYGVIPNPDGTFSAPLVQASVFTYDSVESAADRIDTVVTQSRNAGDRTEDVPVGDEDGVVMVSVTEATLVVAVEDRTYSITLAPGLVADDQLNAALASLASSAINGGDPLPTSTPSAGSTSTS